MADAGFDLLLQAARATGKPGRAALPPPGAGHFLASRKQLFYDAGSSRQQPSRPGAGKRRRVQRSAQFAGEDDAPLTVGLVPAVLGNDHTMPATAALAAALASALGGAAGVSIDSAFPEYIEVGRNRNPERLSDHLHVVEAVRATLVPDPSASLFLTGVGGVMELLNSHTGQRLRSGIVNAILRQVFLLESSQQNICRLCGQVCTRKNCADHYHEAVLNRNRLTVVKGIGRAAEVVSANVYSYPLTAVTSLPMMTVSAGPGFLTADQIQANAGGGDSTLPAAAPA